MTATLPTSIDERCAFTLADKVFATGNPMACEVHGIVVVPDLMVLEGIANGEESPNTWRIQRGDGREVSIFALPDGSNR